MAFIFRKIYLIFKTAEGKTKFSKGNTPFQPSIVRMMRQIGVLSLAIPVAQIIMSIIAGFVIGQNGTDMAGKTMDYSIILAKNEHVPAIRRVMDEAVAALASRDWYIDDDEDFIRRHIHAEGFILLAMVREQVFGFLMVRHPGKAPDHLWRFLDDEKSLTDPIRVSHIESMAVLPVFSGQGIISSLMKEAERIEKQRGTCCLMATVHPENAPSMRTFEKAEFSVVCQAKMYGGQTRYVLKKDLA